MRVLPTGTTRSRPSSPVTTSVGASTLRAVSREIQRATLRGCVVPSVPGIIGDAAARSPCARRTRVAIASRGYAARTSGHSLNGEWHDERRCGEPRPLRSSAPAAGSGCQPGAGAEARTSAPTREGRTRGVAQRDEPAERDAADRRALDAGLVEHLVELADVVVEVAGACAPSRGRRSASTRSRGSAPQPAQRRRHPFPAAVQSGHDHDDRAGSPIEHQRSLASRHTCRLHSLSSGVSSRSSACARSAPASGVRRRGSGTPHAPDPGVAVRSRCRSSPAHRQTGSPPACGR